MSELGGVELEFIANSPPATGARVVLLHGAARTFLNGGVEVCTTNQEVEADGLQLMVSRQQPQGEEGTINLLLCAGEVPVLGFGFNCESGNPYYCSGFDTFESGMRAFEIAQGLNHTGAFPLGKELLKFVQVQLGLSCGYTDPNADDRNREFAHQLLFETAMNPTAVITTKERREVIEGTVVAIAALNKVEVLREGAPVTTPPDLVITLEGTHSGATCSTIFYGQGGREIFGACYAPTPPPRPEDISTVPFIPSAFATTAINLLDQVAPLTIHGNN